MLKKAFLLCCLFCFSHMNFAENENENENNLSPEEVVKEFYHDYLVAFDMPVDKGFDATLAAKYKYTTKHIRELENASDTGSDYFLFAQESCPEWKDNIYPKTKSINDNKANVSVVLGYGDGESLIDINLIKYKSNWLINSVRLESQAGSYCAQQN